MKTITYAKRLLLLLLSITAIGCVGNAQIKSGENLSKPILIEHPERFFWEIKGNNGSVYILGTLHFADKSFFPLEKNVLRTFDKADRLVSELGGLAEMQAFAEDLQGIVLKNMNADPKKNLLHLLSKKELSVLYEQIGEDTVHQLALFNPWLLNTVVTQILLTKMGLNAIDGIDLHLIQRAKNKKIEALDTAQQQIDVLSYGSFEDQLAMLKDTIQALQEFDKSLEGIHTIRDLYLKNDRKKLSALLPELMMNTPSSFPAEKTQAYLDALLTTRNRIWAQKFDEYLQAGGITFVFAGAAHFLGDSSVFEIMRSRKLLE